MYMINTICLPTPENFRDPKFAHRYVKYEKATSFGWGRVEGDKYPDVLQRGDFWVKYTPHLVEKFQNIENDNYTKFSKVCNY